MDEWSFVTCQKIEKMADSYAEKTKRIQTMEEHMYSMSLQYEKQAENDAMRVKMIEEKLNEAISQIESLERKAHPIEAHCCVQAEHPVVHLRRAPEGTARENSQTRPSLSLSLSPHCHPRRLTTTVSRRTDVSSSSYCTLSTHNRPARTCNPGRHATSDAHSSWTKPTTFRSR